LQVKSAMGSTVLLSWAIGDLLLPYRAKPSSNCFCDVWSFCRLLPMSSRVLAAQDSLAQDSLLKKRQKERNRRRDSRQAAKTPSCAAGLSSGFIPEKVTGDLDFIAMHIYPEKGKVDEAIETLKGFASVGKPVVIEEVFPLKCGAKELEQFIDKSKKHATGWIGFYWGMTPAEYRPPKTVRDAIVLSWLELFQKKGRGILPMSPE
jgi:hypothetical protein